MVWTVEGSESDRALFEGRSFTTPTLSVGWQCYQWPAFSQWPQPRHLPVAATPTSLSAAAKMAFYMWCAAV